MLESLPSKVKTTGSDLKNFSNWDQALSGWMSIKLESCHGSRHTNKAWLWLIPKVWPHWMLIPLNNYLKSIRMKKLLLKIHHLILQSFVWRWASVSYSQNDDPWSQEPLCWIWKRLCHPGYFFFPGKGWVSLHSREKRLGKKHFDQRPSRSIEEYLR